MFISICIPAYKRPNFLRRLLDSISIQAFKDFEVVVTDDSPDNEIKDLCDVYRKEFVLHYFKNQDPLGTPENWNEAIRHAQGQWIKLMHDDDWFSTAESLSVFAKAIEENPERSFFYSAYFNIYEPRHERRQVMISRFKKKELDKNPVILFSKNVVGPPSAVLFRNEQYIFFDNRMKWLVDIDYYIQYLKKESPVYIKTPIINIGIHNEQVTRSTFRVATVEIPESFALFEKVGIRQLKNIIVYDAWWRLIRNLRIRSQRDIVENGYPGEVDSVILSMIKWQTFFPTMLLRLGIFSKFLMFIHYLFHRSFLDK